VLLSFYYNKISYNFKVNLYYETLLLCPEQKALHQNYFKTEVEHKQVTSKPNVLELS
jgi:hypothetical protein